mmetsp:Transcript_99191/g.319863  ORF Transcript_99191/g.319863 Transcript_99191/m.319863 type:complete len:216 (-) Transcript_99191:869-1516(-)
MHRASGAPTQHGGGQLRLVDPVASRSAIRAGLSDEPAPASVVELNEAVRLLNSMYLPMQSGSVTAAALLEVIHPTQALLYAPRGNAFHILHRARRRQGSRAVRAHHQNFPVCLALIDEADSAQDPATHDGAHWRCMLAQVKHVQWVVVAGRTVEFVHLLGVAVRLREAAVVEGHRSSECFEPPRTFHVLLDHVARLPWLHLVLFQCAERDLVDIV